MLLTLKQRLLTNLSICLFCGKALLHSLFVMDFSGEVQQSLDAVLRQQDYQQSRKVFFQELQKHFARLIASKKRLSNIN